MKSDNIHFLSNRSVRFGFERDTGRLVSAINRVTGNDCLRASNEAGNVFCVYYDFAKEFEITGAPGMTPYAAPKPSNICHRVFSPREAHVVAMDEKRSGAFRSLTMTYADEDGQWRVKLTVTLVGESPSSIWKMNLENTGPSPLECMCSFPRIGGVSLGNGRRNMMVVHDQAGYILPLWSATGGIYGNASHMSMQWGCVFDEASRDALAFIVRDPGLRNKQIRYDKPSIEVSYFPPRMLKPGESVTIPDTEILVYGGDWKRAAVAYSAWFSRHYKSVKHATWVRNLDGHGSGWFAKRDQSRDERYNRVTYPLDSFAEIADLYRLAPMETCEFAFHCRRSMPTEVTGKSVLWTDADTVIREDLGGAKALKEGLSEVHDLGGHFTFYMDCYLCPEDSDLALEGKAREWAVMNKDGSNTGNYTKQGKEIGCGFYHMCFGAKGWQRHLARRAADLVKKTGADGIRLDSLGFYSFPCYNPAHKHKSPFDHNQWACELLETVAAAVRKVNPHCLLTTEAGPDFYTRHFDGCLTQHGITHTHKTAVSRDVAPMRVAVPDYIVLAHVPCGPVAASLMGYPGGTQGPGATGRMVELDLKWRSLRFATADILRWGNAAYDNPTSSRKDVECRRFSDDFADVIVGARPAFPEGAVADLTPERGVALNSNVDLKKGNVTYTVTVDTGRRRPQKLFVWDVEKLAVEEIEPLVTEGKTTFEVKSNWFMALIGYRGSRPIAQMELPLEVSRGDELRVECRLLGVGPRTRLEGRLFAPMSGSKRAIVVSLPGEARIKIPQSTPPGKYLIQLSSKQFHGFRRFVRVRD